jgi:hypothetical protein
MSNNFSSGYLTAYMISLAESVPQLAEANEA